MSACVIPLAPEFQDPVEVKNYPPVIDNTDPPIGATVSTDDQGVGHFRVRISDPNLSDWLHLKLLADYPPADTNTAQLSTVLQGEYAPVDPPSTDTVRVHDTSFGISCASATPKLAASINPHRIVLLVADRDFRTDSSKTGGLYLPQEDGLMAIATWYLNLTCQ